MTDYEIQPLSLHCAATGRELKTGEYYYSVLCDTPEGFVRRDYCPDAWTGPPERAIGFWRSRVPETPAKRRTQIVDDSVVLEFFHQLEGDQEAYKINFRYILTLLLMRRKLLKLAGVERDGEHEILILRSSASDKPHRVVNPNLAEAQLVTLEAEVERVLQTQSE